VTSLEQANVEIGKTTISAGVTGQLMQFALQRGDIVNPVLRPAGILVPTQSRQSGRKAVQAGFSQLAAQVIQEGSIAEMTCLAMPFTIVPMVVTKVQPYIASGQVRARDQLIDVISRAEPGTLTVVMEPLNANGMEWRELFQGHLVWLMCTPTITSD
jgi:multidrug resistance efflux pump